MFKILGAAAALLLVAGPAHADFTATIKCDAKASPTQTYVSVAADFLEAIKGAVAKRKKIGRIPAAAIR